MDKFHLQHIYQFIVFATVKGGVGKTLSAQTVYEFLLLRQMCCKVFQLDDQDRLERTIGHPITTLDIQILKDARKDPTIITKVFDPLYSEIENLPVSREALLFDIGATQLNNFIAYAALTELDEELTRLGLRSLVFVPCVAEPESIRQAARTIQFFEETLPSFDIVLLKNLRDGDLIDLSHVSGAGRIYLEELLPLTANIRTMTMPLIQAGSWRGFEQNHCKFLDVATLSIEEIQSMLGVSRPEAKLARGDVLAFFAEMEQQLSSLLSLPRY